VPKDDRTSSWVTFTRENSFVVFPPPDEVAPKPDSLKRKRAMSLPTTVPIPNSHRSDSLERQIISSVDEVLPEQSASQLSSSTPFPLHERDILSPPTSRLSESPNRSSSSPNRETSILLRSAWPPVVVESLNGLKVAPPKHVEQLGDRLADGVDSSFIPKGLEVHHSVYF